MTSRIRILDLLTFLIGLASCCAFSPAALAQTEDGFDRDYRSVYEEWLFDSKTAYNAKRYDDAFPLMQKAACAGDKESQWFLGQMYLRGQGVDRDDLRGYAWLKVAAEFQSAEYRNTVRTIEDALDAQHKQEAAALAGKFVDEYGMRATHMSCSLSASRQGHIMDRIACVPRYQGKMVLLKRCVGAPIVAK
jgi:hypothetical protein